MPRLVAIALLTTCMSVLAQQGNAVERVSFRDDKDIQRDVVGEVLVEAQNGGMMLRADDGSIWLVQPEQLIERKTEYGEFAPLDDDTMEQRLLQEFDGFDVYRTQHYVLVYNSSEAYAKQVGALFEQLYRGFFTFWKNQRWDLPKPEFPLVAVVLRDRAAFLHHARADIGETAESVIGYYHLSSNRMTTFNVPNWERNVATIIHEATHQLAYNCGLQKRFADNPMWVSEGLATFFETPDLRNPGRWRTIGRVNPVNLMRWRRYLPNRPAESLATLLANDDRYRNPATAPDAYAEGWALTYFLIKTKRREYVGYLKLLSEGKPLAEKTKKERIDVFEEAMGCTLVELDKSFVSYMSRIR